MRAPTLATVPCTVATASSSPGCVCAATHSGRPQSALRRLAILQHTHTHTHRSSVRQHTTLHTTATMPHNHNCSAGSVPSSAQPQCAAAPRPETTMRLLTWRVCVRVCVCVRARQAGCCPHLLGLGLQRCHTLLPSAAAYLRSLHHPGICCSVAPKMRKRPTSCKKATQHTSSALAAGQRCRMLGTTRSQEVLLGLAHGPQPREHSQPPHRHRQGWRQHALMCTPRCCARHSQCHSAARPG